MKQYLFLTIAIFLSVGAYLGFMSSQMATPPPVIDYFQDDNLSVITLDKAPVAKLSAVGKLAGRLGNAGQKINNNGTDVNFQNKDDATEYLLSNSAKGRLSFSKSTKNYGDDFKPRLLDAGQAQKNAEKFLAENDLNPKNLSELKLIHAGGLRASSADDGQIIDKMQTFTYGRVLNGIPVSGNGSRIVVNVGDKGEVLGVSKTWKEVSPNTKARVVNKTELKSQADAQKEFGQLVNMNFGAGVSPEIKSIQKMYYDGGDNFIQPAYFFETIVTVTGENGKKEKQPFLGVVPMLKTAPEAINPNPAEVKNIAKQAQIGQTNKDPNLKNKADERSGNDNK